LPYIYSLAGNVTRNHDTIMRPLAMDFPGDPVVKDLGDQYLFGPSILVKPVTEFRAREVDVYLPGDGEWLDFHSGERYPGGQWIRAGAPLDRMPLFVRAGTILPVGPAVQYSDQALSAPVTLVVYTGADGRFELYEDDGESSAYLQGESSVIPMTYNDRDGTLTIGARVGSWDGMPVTRRFDVRWIDRQGKSATTFDVSPDASIDYRGESVTIRRERHTAEP
jgi:alpha-D-xyloside xylohydrolase